MPNDFLSILQHAADVKEQRKRLMEEQLFQQKHFDAQSELEKHRLQLEEARNKRQEDYQNRVLEETVKQRAFENDRQGKADKLNIFQAIHQGVLRPQKTGPPINVPGIVAGLPQVAPEDQGKPTFQGEGNQNLVPVSPEETAQFTRDQEGKDFNSKLDTWSKVAKQLFPKDEEQQDAWVAAQAGKNVQKENPQEVLGGMHHHFVTKYGMEKGTNKWLDYVEKFSKATRDPASGASAALQAVQAKILQGKLDESNLIKKARPVYTQAYSQALTGDPSTGRKALAPNDPRVWEHVARALDAAKQAGKIDPDTHGAAVQMMQQHRQGTYDPLKQEIADSIFSPQPQQ